MKLTIKPSAFEKHVVLLDGVEIGTIAHTGCGIHKGAAYGTYYAFRPKDAGPVPRLGSSSMTPKFRDIKAAILACLADKTSYADEASYDHFNRYIAGDR